jgi:acetyltransferase-like isoleucine patch superfamily enzyme
MVKKMIKKIRTFIYSVYFNFGILHFRQAIKLPFCCYVWPTIRKHQGKVIFDCPKIRRGMVRLGCQRTPILPQRSLVWTNRGTIIFKGRCNIGHHSLIQVRENGVLEFGDQVGLNSGCRIICQKSIVLKYKVRVSWDCQIFDTNFHPLIDMVTDKPVKMQSPVIIGENVWVGHNVIISKGVRLADGIIVSSGSVVKNTFKIPNCIISGNPAQKVGESYKAEFPDFN